MHRESSRQGTRTFSCRNNSASLRAQFFDLYILFGYPVDRSDGHVTSRRFKIFTWRSFLFESDHPVNITHHQAIRNLHSVPIHDRCQKPQDHRRFSHASDAHLPCCLRLRIKKSEYHQLPQPSIPKVSTFQGFYAKISPTFLTKTRQSHYNRQ